MLGDTGENVGDALVLVADGSGNALLDMVLMDVDMTGEPMTPSLENSYLYINGWGFESEYELHIDSIELV